MNYTIEKSHIDQLTPEQKQKLQELYPPKIGQKIITGKTGKNYVIQKIMRDGKLHVGSFQTWPDNVFPVLNESELIHSLVSVCSSVLMGYGDDINDDDVVGFFWDVDISIIDSDKIKYCNYYGKTLLDTLWEAYKAMVLN